MTIELFDSRKTYTAPAGASLTYNGGPLLDPLKIVGVYLDSFPYSKEMGAFLDWYCVGSSLLTELAEYTFSGSATHARDVSLSLATAPVPVPPVPVPPPVHSHCPPGCVRAHHRGTPQHVLDVFRHRRQITSGSLYSDRDLQLFVARHLSAGDLPAADNHTLYLLFLPSGVSVTIGGDESCRTFCGYHSSYKANNGVNVVYAILPFPTCDGCTGGLSTFDALTSTTSHEIAEAITDPVNGSGWVDANSGEEIGDICAWQTRMDSGFTVQKEWSNQKNACI